MSRVTIDRRRFNQLVAALVAGASVVPVQRALAATAARPGLPLIVLDAGHGGQDMGAELFGSHGFRMSLGNV